MNQVSIQCGLALTNIPEIIAKNRGKSIGIFYLPEALKTSYMYIYVPKSGERRSESDVFSLCQNADIQFSIVSDQLHDSDQAKVIRLSRAFFQGDRFIFCQLGAANLDPEFVAHFFCTVTNFKKTETSFFSGIPLNRRHTI